ncbi:MAG: DMT family transporter [Gammaproteobacteria bacterium]|nr:DMT family transporter [Gammaproteobacteria bacterium]
MTNLSSLDIRGAWSIALGASVWGLFWYPLRLLDSMGFKGTVAIALVSLLGALVAIVVALLRNQGEDLMSFDAWLIGSTMGLSCVLYFLGIMVSDVIRVVFLFYLLPIWTTIAARILYQEVITPIQLVFILLALIGLWLLLGGGTELPLPKGLGDWCGLAAGITWALCLSMLRGRSDPPPVSTTAVTLLCTGLFALIIVVSIDHPVISGQLPSMNAWYIAVPLGLLFGGLILFPSMLGQIWGARLVPAPTAALLTMTEIILATVSAYLIIGTELNSLSMLGGLIIVSVVCVDLVLKHRALADNP